MPSTAIGESLSPRLLEAGIRGLNLRGSTLGEQIGRNAVQLVFLRHPGCIFCRETIADLRKAHEEEADYPEVLFFSQADVERTRSLFQRLWPEAAVICDPELSFYDAFGVGRGSLGQILGPGVWPAGVRAMLKGHFVGRPVGDPWIMPGFLLVIDRRIVWRHRFHHSGDHPDYRQVATSVGELGEGQPDLI